MARCGGATLSWSLAVPGLRSAGGARRDHRGRLAAVHACRHGTGEERARDVLNTPRAAMRPNPGSTFAIDHSWYEERIVDHEDGSCSIDKTCVKELVDERFQDARETRVVGGHAQPNPAIRLRPIAWPSC